MKKCLKCIHINLLPEDYALASKLKYVVEDKPGHLYGELTTPPLCIHIWMKWGYAYYMVE